MSIHAPVFSNSPLPSPFITGLPIVIILPCLMVSRNIEVPLHEDHLRKILHFYV